MAAALNQANEVRVPGTTQEHGANIPRADGRREGPNQSRATAQDRRSGGTHNRRGSQSRNHESRGPRVSGQHRENTVPREVVASSGRASHAESRNHRDLRDHLNNQLRNQDLRDRLNDRRGRGDPNQGRGDEHNGGNLNPVNHQIHELQCQIEELRRREAPRNTDTDLLEETESPFTEEIRMAIMPDRLNLPDSKYDGTGDPADHLENYRSWMELNSATNAFKYRAFNGGNNNNRGRPPPAQIPRFREYTPLTETVATVFNQAEHRGIFNYPPGIRTPANKRDNTKYCRFHRDTGHTTEECRVLKDEVERLIQRGQLREYVRGANQQPRQPAQPVARPQPQDNHDLEVRTIMGGPATGETNRARKNYARQSRTDPFPHQVNLTGHKEKIPRLSDDPIIFTESEARGLWHPHTDAIMVTLRIAGRKVFRILVDNESSTDILFKSTFNRMNLVGVKIEPTASSLSGFTGDSISSEGILNLPVELGSSPCQHIQAVDFVLFDCPSPCNAIIGRPTLNKIRAVTSTYHLLVKFPTVGGIGILRGNQTESREIYEAANRSVQVQGIKSLAKSRDETPTTSIPNENGSVNNSEITKAAGIHGVNAIHLRDGVHRVNSIMIGTIEVKIGEVKKFDELDPREPVAEQHGEPVEELTEVPLFDDEPEKTCKIGSALTGQFKEDLIIFLREHRDVFAWSHEDMPGIDPNVIVHRLNIDPNFKPIKQKRRTFNAERYMAINTEVDKLLKAGFIEEANYPDWIANVVLVKKANGNWRVCVDFTDLNRACPKDSFPLPRIDQLVDATAGHELLSFMDAYSGYNQIRMHEEDQEHTAFLTNQGLYCYKVMSFGLKNARATYQQLVNKMFKDQIGKTMEVYVDDMLVKSLKTEEHIQNLKETFEILRRYKMKLNPSKCAFGVSSGKFLGFMVNHRGIEANPAKIQALLDMEPPRKIKEVQRLTGRIAALNRFISRATDRCKPFFQALRKGKDFIWTADCEQSFQELKSYLGKPHLLSKPHEGDSLILYLAVSKGAVSSALVREEDGVQWPIYYTSKSLLDAETRYPEIQKLALALMFTYTPEMSEKITTQTQNSQWKLYVDGSSTETSSEAGIILVSPDGVKLSCAVRFKFKATNNQAEYEALLSGLRLAKEVSARHLTIYSDSQLVISQVNSEFQAKGEKMASYLEKAKEAMNQFDTVTIIQVPRAENTNADALAHLATGLEERLLKTVPIEILEAPSIDKPEQVGSIVIRPCWMDPIISFLRDGTLPADKFKARRLRFRSARYFLDKGKLYKKGFSSPRLLCLDEDRGKFTLEEVHVGVCGNHSSGRTLAHRILRQGYYWPTIQTDSLDFVRKCDKCQRFSAIPHQAPEDLTTVTSPWPFAKWGIDLIGPLPTARGQLKYPVVVIDYYTKWVEAEALAKITEQNVTAFIWKNIVCRFGVPRELVSDHGTQFENEKLQSICDRLGIIKVFSSPAHPKSNGQVEAVNKTIKQTLKKKLEKSKGA
ncbi:hypothetical protein UlMin_040237 [Ulmus minor]